MEGERSKSKSCGFHLPLALSTEILTRLQAKTLPKFRCVCKEWRSLIHSHNFASFHLNLCKNNRENSHLFVVESTGTWGTVSSSIRCSSTCQRTCQVGLPDCFRNGWVGGYVNGLLLGRQDDARKHIISHFVVWNPSIRKSIEITHPALLSNAFTWVGLGALGRALALILNIYLKSSRYNHVAIFLNGAIHWIGYDVITFSSYNNYVIAFDVQNQVFNYFGLPNLGWDTRSSDDERLGVVRESLVFLDYHGYEKSVVLRVMKEYGVVEPWVKRITINLDFEGLHLRRNSEILFTMAKQRMKAYNFETAEIKDLRGSTLSDKVIFIDDYVQSLMLLTQVTKN
ncbi:hypothetical protein Cgig2_021876 [Carnegiea gigantea]|uniref:F-box domain-containing protein n=1 Tax=Carnegiea gigantea TaxID=171969 RepID=A0A9Q1GV29_9CARY|nr:hypothetical protein Cgig2_021876 [Carnegiea gigantea]